MEMLETCEDPQTEEIEERGLMVERPWEHKPIPEPDQRTVYGSCEEAAAAG